VPIRNLIPSRAIPAALIAAGVMAGSWLAAPGAGALTQPQAHHAVSGVVGSAASNQNERAVLAYWTRARLRAAKPVNIISVGARPDVRPAAVHPTGKPGVSAGGFPDGRGPAVVRPGAGVRPDGYPYSYSSFYVPTGDYTAWPYRLNGALFFVNDGGDYSCSGTSVGSHNGTSNENEVWTAGHCVVNTEANNQVVDSSAIFIPAYNGSATDFDPFGEFVWDGGWETSTAWLHNRDVSEDEAAMAFNSSSTNGRTLGQNVGWDGFAWNWSSNENFTAFGYPAGSPYNGNSMIEDIASTATTYTWPDGAGQPLIGIGNPMTGGSSGGAWNIDWSTSGPGYIDGHNDWKFDSQPLAVYSPYQDTLSNEVRCFGASSC
jgi:hypothetical protein